MTTPIASTAPLRGIAFICVGMLAISLNDVMIKWLSGEYPLHQLVFVRSGIGICFSLFMVHLEGGLKMLKTDKAGLHLLRCLMVIIANMTFFAALATLPLGETTALFFIAPLLITLLSVPLLGERVGPLRLGAVSVGFAGVLIMAQPWAGDATRDVPFWIYLLPIAGAFAYAMMQILTRRLGVSAPASVLAAYIQFGFIVVSIGFFVVAGDGRFADGVSNESLVFLLRAWVWPEPEDIWLMMGLGLMSAIVGYTLSQAYRISDAAVVAPFEFIGLPLALFWGWLFWGELPDAVVSLGIALILGSGLFVFLREHQVKRRVLRARRVQGR